MTNPTKETLELALEVAREVYPGERVGVNGLGTIYVVFEDGDFIEYNPLENTERGKAQCFDLLKKLEVEHGMPRVAGGLSGYMLQGDTLEEAILKQYLETNRKE